MSDTLFLKDNLIGTVPLEISKEIIKNVINQASILKVCKKEPMASDKKTLPRLVNSGSATWVKEGEQIGTTIPDFDYPTLKACKLGVIVPVTNEKINDSVSSVMEEVKQAMADAFATAIDNACIFGINSPFDTNLIDAIGSNKVDATDKLNNDISKAMGLVESNKYICNNILMGLTQKETLRNVKDSNNFKGAISLNSAYDTPIEYVRDWDNTKALSIMGDFSKAIIGTRENIEYKVLDQATITTGTGENAKTINLAQHDMIAIKATMRLGFVVVEPKAFASIIPAGE